MAEVVKAFPARGPLQQVRVADLETFRCFRCGELKRSKLLALYEQDWSRRLCNGCYGFLLSIYEVKAGAAPEDERVDALAHALLKLVEADKAASEAKLEELASSGVRFSLSPPVSLRSRFPWVVLLSADALRLVESSLYVAERLRDIAGLEWSAAVIGLCKAVELEVVRLVMEPLRLACAGRDLAMELQDAQLRRLAAWCGGSSHKPPELGTIAHTLRVLAGSKTRQQGQLAAGLSSAALAWADPKWLLTPDGLADALDALTRDFRNPAAHLDLLDANDYEACQERVLGRKGILRRLPAAA